MLVRKHGSLCTLGVAMGCARTDMCVRRPARNLSASGGASNQGNTFLFGHAHCPAAGASSGYGRKYRQWCTRTLAPRLPSVPPMLSHVTASECGPDPSIQACETCSLDAAPQRTSRSRRKPSVCAARAPMHPRSAHMPAAATIEPHARRQVAGHRSAHGRARGVTGMIMLHSAVDVRWRRSGGTCSCSARRRQLVADRL
eukprot:4675164-Prymnesium_polylepis.2